MCKPERVSNTRLTITPDDWVRIISALGAYSHNVEYRDLLARLEQLAKINGIEPSQRLSS
jgi:hypothetical protein